MNNLTIRPSFFDEMVPLREGVSSLFDKSFLSPSWSGMTGGQKQPWSALNVYEDNQNYYILGLFPGLDPQKLDLNVKENVLTIKGEYDFNDWLKTPTVEGEGGNGHKQRESQYKTLLAEIPQGEFFRQIQLPATFDFDKVGAYYEQGVLKLVLPKSERSQGKRISVQTVMGQAGGSTGSKS